MTNGICVLYSKITMYIPRIAEKSLEEFLKSEKVLIILGARQVGKTTLIEHVLRNKKITTLNLDVESDRDRLKAASSLDPADIIKSLGDPEIIVIDEAQRWPKTSQIVKGWFDKKIPVKVILLGSSSLDLLDQSAESLTGRNEKLFLPPLVFREIIQIQSWYSNVLSDNIIQKNFANQIQELLIRNIIFGNYPEVVKSANKDRLLFNLISDYLLKDILQIGLVKIPEFIRRFLMLLAYQVGQEVSIQELANNLSVSRETISRYLDLLEQTFVIFRLRAFSTNPRKEIAKSQKIYFWDTGIRNALLDNFSLNPLRSDIGALWENWIMAEFAKLNLLAGNRKQFYFWRSRSGGEVDLIIKEGENLRAIEIKWQKRKTSRPIFAQRYNTKIEIINRTKPLISF